ncbi:MAG: prepilin-type N-terminal cleavage/methylation domain-containing protein [candidate division Zixibacteria bacterium]|nr:prepilin-type N-terminal cleavage/methylation domain-containing protein [candidate division Zixibacteria bacterium]
MNSIKNKRGFTLVELMIVVVIVGILAALAIGRYLTATTKVKQSEAKGILKQIYTLERAYFQEYGHYWPSDGSTISADSSIANRGNFSMLAIKVEIMENARYHYALTGNPNNFNVVATATGLDDDPTNDVWRIDNTGTLACVSDDSQN